MVAVSEDTVYAEIERVIRLEVRVNVARFVAENASDRATFDGSDAEYVKACIRDDPREYLDACSDTGDGVTVTEEWDETEAAIL